jgi:hypothetical protein
MSVAMKEAVEAITEDELSALARRHGEALRASQRGRGLPHRERAALDAAKDRTGADLAAALRKVGGRWTCGDHAWKLDSRGVPFRYGIPTDRSRALALGDASEGELHAAMEELAQAEAAVYRLRRQPARMPGKAEAQATARSAAAAAYGRLSALLRARPGHEWKGWRLDHLGHLVRPLGWTARGWLEKRARNENREEAVA